VNASFDGTKWLVDLSDKRGTDMLTQIEIEADQDVTGGTMEVEGITKEIMFENGSAVVSISDLQGDLDTGVDGVSLQMIRKYGFSTFIATLQGDGRPDTEVTIEVLLPPMRVHSASTKIGTDTVI